MIGAYDPETGSIAIGASNGKISAETLDPRTVGFIESKLGVKIGEFTSICANRVGACAEVSAADQLVRKGFAPEDIKFTNALRPKTVLESGVVSKSIIETCPNCAVVWPGVK
ncbi:MULTISPECIES: hypothetical protein [unclassified Pseudomonas]|jgi:filamentous hemagglutinin|uniref:hypothetical protein n=1 Tax=unclassified Pseudomonas TaxID=196821 RepID=UPI0015A99455|nr:MULTISPECIES: hypothetical protein [unclassified Pseudomonas]MCU1737110.1 hypothetical protein [Pseudomonas sp. 20S_6.2_Bac1]